MKEGQHSVVMRYTMMIRKSRVRGVVSTERNKAGKVCSSANGPAEG